MRGRKILYEENHREVNGILEKRCNRCEQWFPATLEYFYNNDKNKTDGLYPYCIECGKNNVRQWRKENPEEYKELNHKINTNPSDKTKETYRINAKNRRDNGKYYEWLFDNPDKQTVYIKNHRQHDITEKEWKSCLKVFENKCAYCGLPIEKHIVKLKGKYIIMNFHKEHVDDEGYNDLRNCVPACRECNSAKHTFIMKDWFAKQKFFDEERYNKIIWWITEGYKDYIENKPPYKILRKQNEDKKTFHFELWSVDKQRNMIELIDIKNKKKDLQINLIENQDKYFVG